MSDAPVTLPEVIKLTGTITREQTGTFTIVVSSRTEIEEFYEMTPAERMEMIREVGETEITLSAEWSTVKSELDEHRIVLNPNDDDDG